MTYDALITALDAMADPTVAPYQNMVISDTGYPMKYIRVPVLRKLAKELAQDEWKTLLAQARFESFEEVLVFGLAIAYAKGPFADKQEHLRRILPLLDSWALTDSIVPTLRIGSQDMETVWAFTKECLESDLEYTVRFGIVMILNYFLTPEWIPLAEQCLVEIRDERYYVRMAISWCFVEMAVRDFVRVRSVLQSGVLDLFTHNMTIRKMRESYRILPEQKAAAAALKRKEQKK